MKKKLTLLYFAILIFTLTHQIFAQDVAVFPQMGHTDQVKSVDFSPNGKYIVSSAGNNIKLWDISTGREIRTFFGNAERVGMVEFYFDGRYILSSTNNATIIMWDVASGKEFKRFSEHSLYYCDYTAFSPDGNNIISVFSDNTSRVVIQWDISSGKEKYRFSIDRAGNFTFSKDFKYLLAVSGDNKLKLWDTATGKEIKTFSGNFKEVNKLEFSPDGRQFIICYNNVVNFYDFASGNEIRNISVQSLNSSSCFSPDGKLLMTGSRSYNPGNYTSHIRLFDVNTGHEVNHFSGDGIIISAKWSKDNKQIASGMAENFVKLWDINKGQEIRTFEGYSSDIRSVDFTPEGHIISSTLNKDNNGRIKLWDAVMGKEIKTIMNYYGTMMISPDGKQVISHGSSSDWILWDLFSEKPIRTFQGKSANVSKDWKYFVSNSGKGNIGVFDIATGKEFKTFSYDSNVNYFDVNYINFSPDGKEVLFATGWPVQRWNVNNGNKIWYHKSNYSNMTYSGCYSPDGKQFISGFSNSIKLWDTITGNELKTFSGTGWINKLDYSPDGKQIISGHENGDIKIWDASAGKEIKTISGHISGVRSVKFYPNGKQILSGSRDGTVRIWDNSTGKEVAQFISFTDSEWIVLTPDGYYNASPNGDKHLNVRVGNNVYGIDQYRSTFYKPQIVEARLQGRSDPVRIAGTIQDLAANEPPVVVIRNPENGAGLSLGQIELSVSVIDQKQPVKNIKIMVNGRLVGGEEMRGLTGTRGLSQVGTGINVMENLNRIEFRFPLTLTAGENHIEVIASNQYSEGRDSVRVNYRQASTRQNILPNLWILAIGVNRYDDNSVPNLNYAVNDARAIIDAFKTQKGKTYRQVNSMLIADGAALAPTKENIVDNFSFLSKAGQRDVVMLFIAGHGMNDDGGNFYFLPSDAAFNADGTIRPSRAISHRDIQAVLDIPGQKLVFIDACHSEGASGKKTRSADNNQLVRSLQDNSTVIFTSSRGSQLSQEDPKLGHGIFTYAIVQGMKGAADLIKDGTITMKELDTYVSETVPKLTNGLQHPTTTTPDGYINFIVAEIK